MTSTNTSMNRARAIIVKALQLSPPYPEILEIYKLPQWDSLGQLMIILELERELAIQIDDENLFENLTSEEYIKNFINSIDFGGIA